GRFGALWQPLARGGCFDLIQAMPRGTPALIKPALLVWARESAGYSREAAAAKSGYDAGDLLKWEIGGDRPSIPQLRKLAEVYRRPLAVFFLPKPPTTFDAQREFRRLSGVTPQNETAELRQALRVALFRREAAKDIYERLGDAIPTFNASAHPAEEAEVVG